MLAVGNEELGARVGTQEACPNCGEPHDVTSSDGYDPDTGEITSHGLLQSVTCPASGKTYLVGVEGQRLPPPKACGEHE